MARKKIPLANHHLAITKCGPGGARTLDLVVANDAR